MEEITKKGIKSGFIQDVRRFMGKQRPCYKDQTLQLLRGEVSLLIGPDTTFIKKGSVFANRAGHYIYQEGKCSC